MSRTDEPGTNPYAAPSQDDDDGRPREPITGELRLSYRYLPRLKPALQGLLSMIALYAFSVWLAVTSHHRLHIGSWIILSASGMTRLFVALAIGSVIFVFFGIFSVTARFRTPIYLVFDEHALSIPLGERRQRSIPYASIRDIQMAKAQGQSRLQLTADGKKVTVDGFMLESDEQMLEVEQALRARVRNHAPRGRAKRSR